jgi:secreted trypsin-like serine protease
MAAVFGYSESRLWKLALPVSAIVLIVLALFVSTAQATRGGSAIAAALGHRPHSVQASSAQRHHPATAHTSIIGGTPAVQGTFPSLAFIADFQSKQEVGLCSGTVISPRLVLTAGHCAVNLRTGAVSPASAYRVVTGSVDWTDESARQVLDVSRVIVYPDFSRLTLHSDAALLVLASPTTAPSTPLATAADVGLLQGSTPAEIAGWGLTEGGAKETPTGLQWATTFVQSAAYCTAHVRAYYPYFSSSMQRCVLEPPDFSVGLCHGDSGGPVLAFRPDKTLVEIGITSLGQEGCATNVPGVFTRVDLVSAWANRWIGGLDASSTAGKPQLPRMTRGKALSYARKGLTENFRARFKHGHEYRARCHRVKSTKQRCGVTWTSGPNDYRGTITVYYAFSSGELTWGDHYMIHWVNDHCYFHTNHRGTCAIYTRRR